MKSVCSLLFLSMLLPRCILAADALLLDDFSKIDLPQRRAERGDWKYSQGVATCTQDDALYKKFKDHGPIIFYDLKHTDARIQFSFKPQDTKTVVFTANGAEGHCFRFVLSSAGLNVRAFPPEVKPKSIALGQEKVPLNMGEWTPVDIQLRGTQAIVKIGDLPAKTYEHASLAQPKVNLSLGFSFGTLSVKDFTVNP